jgi:polyhydroxyalkanoate synthesis regulator phasin
MAGLVEKSLLLGLGVLTLTRDKVVQFVDKLIEEGEVKPEEAPGIVDRLVTRGKELDKVRTSVPRASRKDIEELSQKIDELAARIDELAGKKSEKEK